ncbi:MAG: XcyI family restriction endonuclease [Dehalococcoidia bacterium]|nr:XcyI family restriction endonuclease [Dehalococcoidia bacterium]
MASHQLTIGSNDEETEFQLPNGYSMRYGSEPDIRFQQEQNAIPQVVATIEIKGGKDPAGALERLGAMQKSFEETPPGCVNILIAGVITSEMESRLENMGVSKVFLLDDLAHDGEEWIDFLNEVFHYTIRITDSTITG